MASGIPLLPLTIVASGGVLLYSGIVNQPTTTVLRNVLKGQTTANALMNLAAAASQVSNSTPNSAFPNVGNVSSGGSIPVDKNIQNFSATAMVASTYGWPPGTQNFSALTQVIAMESGGNQNIFNGQGSGAYGIAQALGHGTGSTGGTVTNQYGPISGMNLPNSTYVGANSGNAVDQLIWMCAYIQAKFGNPVNAYNYHLANNSY